MTSRLTIDKAGRVVIPKPVRDELRLGPGDSLEMDRVGEQITLRPVRGAVPLRKEQGVWVFYGGHPIPASTTDRVIQEIREERHRNNLGEIE